MNVYRFILAGLVAISARSAMAEDLIALYHEAQGSDSTFAAAKANYNAGLEQLPQARAGLLPTLSLSANSQYNDRNISFRDPIQAIGIPGHTQFNSNRAVAQATQPIFRIQNWASYMQAEAQVDQAEAVFRQAQADLITRFAQAYFDAVNADNALAYAQGQKKAIGQQLAQAKRSFEIGTNTVTDADDAQARYDLASAQEIGAKTDLEVKRRALQQILGRAPGHISGVRSDFPLSPPDPADLDAWTAKALETSPEVQAATAAVEVARQQINIRRAGHLPSVDAVAVYSADRQGAGPYGGAGIDTDTAYVGVQVSMPLFQGGLVWSQVKQAAYAWEKAKDDLETARRKAAYDVQAAYTGAVNGIEQVRALQSAVSSSQSSVGSSKKAFEVGVRTQVDVLNAEQQLISAQNNLSQAVYGYVLSILKLKAAAGALTEADLAYLNQWLQGE